MLTKDIAAIFRSIAEGEERFGRTAEAKALQACATALMRQRAKLTVKEALAFWSGCSPERPEADSETSPMSARKAADHLQVVAEAAKPVARKQSLSVLGEFIAFLQGKGDAPAAATMAAKVQPVVAPGNSDWVARLTIAGTDRAKFDAVMDGLLADRELKLETLNEIAGRYTGSTRKSRSKKEAFERIRDHFEIDAQYKAKAAVIDRLTGGTK